MKQAMYKHSIGVFALGMATSIQGWAQEADGAQPNAAQKPRAIEEVIVTAQRREESAQSVPVSINAFSADTMSERQVVALGDLTKVAPGIRFVHQGGGGNMNVVLRGLSRIPIGSAPNAVINYFADIPLAFEGSNLPTYDLANIQVLKGPQGTLFGRNAIGGAVIITPQAPTYDVNGYIKGSLGNYHYHDVEGALNLPLVDDKLALRVAGKSSRRDGYTKNLGTGNDQDDMHQDAFRASLLWEPVAGLRNTTVFDYLRADEAGTGSILTKVLNGGLVRFPALAPFWDCHQAPTPCVGFQPNNDIDDALAQQKAWGPYKTTSEVDQIVFRELQGVSNRTEWELGPVTLRNIFGYRSTEVNTDLNTDGVSFVPNIITASSRVHTQQYSDEFHVFGKALDDKLDYLAGLFWIKEEPHGKNGSIFPVATLTAPWIEAYTTKTNKAAFGQIGYDLSSLLDGVKFNAGYRFNKTDQEVCAITSAATNILLTPMPPLGESTCQNSPTGSVVRGHEHANTYNIGLDWRVNDNVFTYITHRKGYREGGINAPAFNTPASAVLAPYQTYEPETLKDVEIGLKTDFSVADRPVRFNLAVYQSKYDNVVSSFNTSAIVPATDTGAPLQSSLAINTGNRTLSGFESELTVELLDDLTISNSAAYTHQKIDKSELPAIPGLQPPSLDPASPQWSTTLSLRWTLPFRPLDSDMVLNADYYWQDSYFVANGKLPGYDVTNLRLDWKNIGQSGVDAGLFVRNVFDQEYAYAADATQDSLGIYTLAFAEPRMFGVEISYKFGR